MSTNAPLSVLTLICALGSGLIAGFFFAFSICVMKALEALPPSQGIAAMQSINVVVINRWFLTAFFGTAAAGAASLLNWHDPRAAYWLVGAGLYLVASILVTMVFNVPRNNALAAVAANSVEGATLWAGYLITWTHWNHVRSVAALLAAASFTMALTR